MANANGSQVVFHNTLGDGENDLVAWYRTDRRHHFPLAADSDLASNGASFLAIRHGKSGSPHLEYIAVPNWQFVFCRRARALEFTLTPKGFRDLHNVSKFNDGVKNNGMEELLLSFLAGSHDWSLPLFKFPGSRLRIHKAGRCLREAGPHPAVNRPTVAANEVRADLARQARAYVQAVLNKCVELSQDEYDKITDAVKKADHPFAPGKVDKFMAQVSARIIQPRGPHKAPRRPETCSSPPRRRP